MPKGDHLEIPGTQNINNRPSLSGSPSRQGQPTRQRRKSDRLPPTKESLRGYGITICNNPKRNDWSCHVQHLYSRLVGSFSGLIPKDMESSHLWRKIPADAVENRNLKPCDKMLKDRRVQCALKMKNLCDENIRMEAIEHAWNRLWWSSFQDHVLANRTEVHGIFGNGLEQFCDYMFGNQVLDHAKPGQPTLPKPDSALIFKTYDGGDVKQGEPYSKYHSGSRYFDKRVLDKLREDHGLQSSPFPNNNVCFPWAIYEGKGFNGEAKPDAECQAANGAVKCLKILENLKKMPRSPQMYQDGTRLTLPIPCFTCRGQNWVLWICRRSNEDDSQPNYVLDRIFEGDMRELWSCLQLLCILERLRDWALDTFKPWVDKYLSTWIKYSENLSLERILQRESQNGIKSHYGATSKGENNFNSWTYLNDSSSKLPPSNYSDGGFNDSAIYLEDDNSDELSSPDSEDEDDFTDSGIHLEDECAEFPFPKQRVSKDPLNDLLWLGTQATKNGAITGYDRKNWFQSGSPAGREQEPCSRILSEFNPAIEKLVKISRRPLLLSPSQYLIKWKDCWVTGRHISGSRERQKYQAPNPQKSKIVIHNGESLVLHYIKFREVWVKEEYLDENEMGFVKAVEAKMVAAGDGKRNRPRPRSAQGQRFSLV